MKHVRLNAEAITDMAAAQGIDYMAELARQAGLHRSLLHRILKGSGEADGRDARPSHVLALAKALHRKPSELLDDSEDPDFAALLDAEATDAPEVAAS